LEELGVVWSGDAQLFAFLAVTWLDHSEERTGGCPRGGPHSSY